MSGEEEYTDTDTDTDTNTLNVEYGFSSEKIEFGKDIPELPASLKDPKGPHKGTKHCSHGKIDRHGLPYIAINKCYGGFSEEYEENGYNRLPRNHPNILTKSDCHTYSNHKIYQVNIELLPYIYIEEYDGYESIALDTSAMELDIALERIKELEKELERVRSKPVLETVFTQNDVPLEIVPAVLDHL